MMNVVMLMMNVVMLMMNIVMLMMNLHSADVTHITGNFEKSSPENFY
ncbi:hypothetical protein LC574_23505 [Nostoc sp. CHAB 5715]|nr:hypothetical protein [Nostoc sp. CHAB 5715]